MKTYLVTGANSGVGLALTHLLAEKAQHVILGVRDLERGQRARQEVLRAHPQAHLDVERIDLTDLDSVRALADKRLSIDVLINNAGVAFEPMALTKERVLSQFAANHLGHFLLTALLWPQLERVVVVTSTLAKSGAFDLDNLDGSRGYKRMKAYQQSKLAQTLFAAELARRGDKTVVLAHPGVPATNMQKSASGVIGVIVRTVAALVGKPPSFGAAAVLEAALAGKNGELYGPGPKREKAWPSMSDRDGAERLWRRSEALTAVSFDPASSRPRHASA